MHLHVDTECMSCPFALCCYFIGLKYSAPCRTRLRSSHKRRLVDCGFFSWLKLLRKPKRRNTTSAASATMLCGVEFKYPPMQCAPAIIEGQRVVKCYTASRCQHPSTRIRRGQTLARVFRITAYCIVPGFDDDAFAVWWFTRRWFSNCSQSQEENSSESAEIQTIERNLCQFRSLFFFVLFCVWIAWEYGLRTNLLR